MRAFFARSAFLAVQRDADSAPGELLQADALRIASQSDAFGLEELLDRERNVFVLSRDDARAHLDNGHATAETAKYLRELEAHVAAAHDNQVFGQDFEIHHRDVGEPGRRVDARERRNPGTATD